MFLHKTLYDNAIFFKYPFNYKINASKLNFVYYIVLN